MRIFKKSLAFALSFSILVAGMPIYNKIANAVEIANMAIGNPCSTTSNIGYYSVGVNPQIVADVSPDGTAVKFNPTTSGGEINFPMDPTVNQSIFDNALSLVFWIKTPAVASTTMYLIVSDKDSTTEQYFATPNNGTKQITTVSRTGVVNQQTVNWYFPIPANFEGYIVMPVSNFTNICYGSGNGVFNPGKISNIKMYFEPNQPIAGQSVYVDNIGATTDTQGCIDGFLKQIQIKPDTILAVGNSCAATADIGYKSIGGVIENGISPSESAVKLTPTTGGGEINFPIDRSGNQPVFDNALDIVFWIKTPNVASTSMYLGVYDKDTSGTEQQFSFPRDGSESITTISSGGVVSQAVCNWYFAIPANFEGYIVIPASTFSSISAGTGNGVFDVGKFTMMKIYFEPNQAIAGQDIYIDNIGVTKTNHRDNSNMIVGNELRSASDIGWKSIAAVNSLGISPDGDSVKITPVTSGGEVNFPVSTAVNALDSAVYAQSLVFWIKTPLVTNTTMYMTVTDKDSTSTEQSFGCSNNGTMSLTTVSSEGVVTQRTCNWYLPIPGNFEGYVIIPLANFPVPGSGSGNGVFDPDKFTQMKIYFEANQEIAGKDIYIDDIGITSNTPKYINGLTDPTLDNRLNSLGMGFYGMDCNINPQEFNKLLNSNYCNTFIIGRSQYTIENIVQNLRQINNYGKSAWLGIAECMFNYYSGYTIQDPNWQDNLDLVMDRIEQEGLTHCIRGIYFDEPFLGRISRADFIEVTQYFRQTYPGKGIYACFSVGEVCPSVWYPDYTIDTLDSGSGAYLTDIAFDYYDDIRTPSILVNYNTIAAEMKSRIGRSDVKIWYTSCTMSYRGTTDEDYSIAHFNNMYVRLQGESLPGGLMNYTYYSIPPEIEPLGNIGLDWLFAPANQYRWATLETSVKATGRKIVDGVLD